MNIRRLRIAAGLSQEALGLAANIEPGYIGRIERGSENVSIDVLEKIAGALAIDDLVPLFTAITGEVPPGLRPGPKPRSGGK